MESAKIKRARAFSHGVQIERLHVLIAISDSGRSGGCGGGVDGSESVSVGKWRKAISPFDPSKLLVGLGRGGDDSSRASHRLTRIGKRRSDAN